MTTNELIMQALGANGETIFGLSTQVILILVLIEVVLKGLAMWKAAEKHSKVWFWCLLVINTMGILPLVYLLMNRRKR